MGTAWQGHKAGIAFEIILLDLDHDTCAAVAEEG
jgi:hypothetical protein